MTDEKRELMRIAAANYLANYYAGRKCDPNSLFWAQWTVDHIKPLGRPVGPCGPTDVAKQIDNGATRA